MARAGNRRRLVAGGAPGLRPRGLPLLGRGVRLAGPRGPPQPVPAVPHRSRGLGYGRYFAQGGDWGAAVTAALAVEDPDHCVAIHLNLVSARPDRTSQEELTQQEQAALEALAEHQRWGTGYSTQQATRPQTLG